MTINKDLLDVLVCPLCKGKLRYVEDRQQLICRFDRLAFPIINSVPVMLVTKACKLKQEDLSI